jgi:Sec7-like guanine-nucleotide exchange factor
LKKNSEKNLDESKLINLKSEDKHIIKLNRLYLLKLEKGIFSFNLKLYDYSYKQLKSSGIILNEEEFAEILLVLNGFDKFIIGDFLSKEKYPNINCKILQFFLDKIEMKNVEILSSLRFLLSRLNLPKDSSLIMIILDKFTVTYYDSNIHKEIYSNSNSLFLLCNSILAINTILHRGDLAIANLPNINKESFIKMNSDIDSKIVGDIYDEIKMNKLDFTYECNKLINKLINCNK